MNIPASSATSGSDLCIWSCDKHGHFSVKSAYKQLVHDSWDGKDMQWKLLWHLHIPKRMYFLWLASNGKLLTNLNGFIHNLTDDPVYTVCGTSKELILHVLRDCDSAANLWLSGT
ncbi:hypothetical protein V6N11_052243 [Hibiscus sabdariffa]|uniref:Reverse transcriptase zinc-binding domain-containing protein n=1 Tax=Hibiscus sabdariffa TaxID=183260 RepID=A0ABR2U9I7_9ROSI